MTAKQIIDRAKSQIGVCENPPNSNNVKYNTWYYGHPVSGPEYPWCAVFISWLFKAEQGICPRTASCVNMLAWFEKKRQLVNKPQAGDIVFFKYNTNNRRTNHVGLVVSVSDDGRTINTIEGNTSISSQDNGGKVMQRNRYSNIVAYARPRYIEGTLTNITGRKSLEEVARDVIRGKYGVMPERKQKLEAEGYNYEEVRAMVNKLKSK
jgi:hypothetical protein